MKYALIVLLNIISNCSFSQDYPLVIHVHPPHSYDLTPKEKDIVNEVSKLISLNNKLISKVKEVVQSQDSTYSNEVKKYILDEYLRFYDSSFQFNMDIILTNLIKYNLLGGNEWELNECEEENYTFFINLIQRMKVKNIFNNHILINTIGNALLSSNILSDCNYFKDSRNKEYFIHQHAFLFSKNIKQLKTVFLNTSDSCTYHNLDMIIKSGENDSFLGQFYN